MRRLGMIYLTVAGFFLSPLAAWAQTSLDAMEQDLDLIKEEHKQAAELIYSTSASQLDSAIRSPGAALDLYRKAGGSVPDDLRVRTEHEHETTSERTAREGLQNMLCAGLAYIAQVHCGLMRYGLAFILKPDQPGLHEQWVAWIKSTAQIYPQLNQTPSPNIPDGREEEVRRLIDQSKREMTDLMRSPVRESVITKYLNIYTFGDKDQGQWKVSDIPKLYRKEVLDPLHTAGDPNVVAAWDIYIAMRRADATDDQKWTQIESVYLTFQRDCDDFMTGPNTDKLSTLVALVKAHADHPQADDMIAQVHQMLESYRTVRGLPAPTPSPGADGATNGPSVTVTSVQSGQSQIITTTTNAAPVAPPTPSVAPVAPVTNGAPVAPITPPVAPTVPAPSLAPSPAPVTNAAPAPAQT